LVLKDTDISYKHTEYPSYHCFTLATFRRIYWRMKRCLKFLNKQKSGQAMTEYVVVFLLLMGTFVMLAIFLFVFKEYGGRVLDLVASEYP